MRRLFRKIKTMLRINWYNILQQSKYYYNYQLLFQKIMRDTLVEMENRLKSRLENDLSSLKESIGGDISSIHQLLKKKL